MAQESVLIIDDDPMVITLCTRILEGQGFKTKGALNGKEASELFDKESFDLILLDIKLPDVNGLDILRAVQKRDPETAVIVITGYGTLETALEALRAGAQGFVLKPITPEELVVAIHDVLEKRQLIRENLRLRARLPLLEISQVLMSEVNFKRLTDLVLDVVVRETGADRVSLMLLDDEGCLSIVSAIGLPQETIRNTRIKIGDGLAGWVVEKGEPLILTDEAEPSPFVREMVQSEIGSAVCMPLMLKGLTIGVLDVSRPKGSRPFRQDDVEFLSILGGQIAIAIENARLYERVIQAEKLSALGRLAASLAHEINNPLQALRSGLALLLSRPLDAEKRQRYIEVANREVERLIGIVERMLNFYRHSTEQQEPTDINTILEEVLTLAGKKIQHGKVSTQTKLATNLPPVRAVASQIQQVFLNLLLNAIESMPDGGQLTITTGLSPDHREALVAFTDTGQGIPEEEIPKVFEPFYTTKLKGTGLGLAISYSIVERHGGRIEIASEVGRGSTFTVRLPVERGEYEPKILHPGSR